MKLTIAIPTIVGREAQFERLKAHIERQIKKYEFRPQNSFNDAKGIVIEIIHCADNKEMSIGAKRQKLLMEAKGEYIVMIDDDDWVPENYIETILPLLNGVDCIGYQEECNIKGKKELSVYSLAFREWESTGFQMKEGRSYQGIRIAGYDHVRTPFYKSPMLTSIARQIGFEDVRFGEDHLFAKAVYPFLKTETFINEIMYFYSPVFDSDFKSRYGIK